MTTPTSKDTSFVPYTMGLDAKFEKCLPDTLIQEGGYSNDAHDPGGMTDYGIIQKEYDAKRRQWGLPTQWVKNITQSEVRTIYYTDYWLPYGPQLPAGLDLECFDQCVNEGSHRAIILLQIALKIPADGAFGPQTFGAVKAAMDTNTVPLLIDRYKMAREAFYHALSTFQYFGKDWIRRSETIGKQAEVMAVVK
jgi:lysozyme family protein